MTTNLHFINVFLLIMAHFNQKWNHNRMYDKVWLLPISGLIKVKGHLYLLWTYGHLWDYGSF